MICSLLIVVLAVLHFSDSEDQNPIKCDLPTSLVKEGCAACWSYKLTEQITVQIVGYEKIDSVDQDQLEICSQTFGLPKDVILSFGRDFMCTICPAACKSKTVSKNKTVTTRVCEVNTTAIYEECIPDNTTVFLLESPKDLPAQVICYWNVPKSQRTYTNLLQQDILGMPPAGCLNKLITVESGNNFRASCGDISFASKALRLTNELTPGSPDIIYLREYESNDTFSILFVLLETSENSIPGKNITICKDMQPRVETRLLTSCKCEDLPESVDQICPNITNNEYYKKLDKIKANTTYNGSSYGYYGYKGCEGADFFLPNGTFQQPSEKECKKSKLGMTKYQGQVFMKKCEALWRVISIASPEDPFCYGNNAPKPNARQLNYLEKFLTEMYITPEEFCKWSKGVEVMERVSEATSNSGCIVIWNICPGGSKPVFPTTTSSITYSMSIPAPSLSMTHNMLFSAPSSSVTRSMLIPTPTVYPEGSKLPKTPPTRGCRS